MQKILCLFFVMSVLAACGERGDLYLPDENRGKADSRIVRL